MTTALRCPKCNSEYVYRENTLMVCAECAAEWSPEAILEVAPEVRVVDSNGVQLHDGDAVMIIKDLKVKGASGALKVGTKVKGIRIVDGDHNIDCRIDGFGAMRLKSEFVRKV